MEAITLAHFSNKFIYLWFTITDMVEVILMQTYMNYFVRLD